MNNVNHKNYFAVSNESAVKKPTEEVIEEPIAVVLEEVKNTPKEPAAIVELDITDKNVLFALNKDEQIEILTNLGLSKTEIKKLRVEKQRVAKILSFLEK